MQNNSLTINLSEKDMNTIKDTKRWIKSWGQNKSFFGLCDDEEEEEEEEETTTTL
jgi:hypothetical protein